MTQDQKIQMASSIAILASMLASVVVSKRYRDKEWCKYVFYWLAIGLVMLVAYSYKDDLQKVGYKVKAALMPHVTYEQNGEIIIKRSMNDHFIIEVKVNDNNIKFLVDTGASSVVLSLEDAKQVGIDIKKLSYSTTVYTANGKTQAARSKADIKIGSQEFKDFPVLIAQLPESESLLGMTLINEFKSFTIEMDTLRLTY